MNRNMPCIAFVLLLSACATAYQPKGFTGGFSETQLRRDIYRVRFKGNGYTSAERAVDFTLLRCAELALENGYEYFLIIDESQYTIRSTIATPTTTKTTATISSNGNHATGTATSTTYGGQTFFFDFPRTSNTILLLENPITVNGMSYEARIIINSVKKNYGIGRRRGHSIRQSTVTASGMNSESENINGAKRKSLARQENVEYADNFEYNDGVSEMDEIKLIKTSR